MALSMPKTQREQIMVLVAIVGLAAAGLFWYFKYNPRSAELGAMQTRVDHLDSLNTIAKAKVATATEAELRDQAQAVADNLALMNTLVPSSNEVPLLLDQVSMTSRRVGLDVGTFKPMGPEEGRDFDVYRYELRVAGSYHAIAQFLTNVASLSRIVVPVNLELTMVQNPPAPVGSGARRNVLAAMQLHTFVGHPPRSGDRQ